MGLMGVSTGVLDIGYQERCGMGEENLCSGMDIAAGMEAFWSAKSKIICW